MCSQQQRKQNNNSDLMRYASLGTQIFVSLGIAVYIGFKADQWINLRFPLLVWLLPFLVLTLLILKMIKETSKKNKPDE